MKHLGVGGNYSMGSTLVLYYVRLRYADTAKKKKKKKERVIALLNECPIHCSSLLHTLKSPFEEGKIYSHNLQNQSGILPLLEESDSTKMPKICY